MQSIHDLFEYELRDILGAEEEVQSALDELSRCESNVQLQQVFATHYEETQNQIDRLHQVFSVIGEPATQTTCEGMQGIIREHEKFASEPNVAPHVHAAFDVGAGQKVEQYEITTYKNLVRMASALGYHQAAELLQTSLAEEREQFQRLENIANAMDLTMPPMTGQQPVAQQQQMGGQFQQQTGGQMQQPRGQMQQPHGQMHQTRGQTPQQTGQQGHQPMSPQR